MQICLGTAQFGFEYGITNLNGKVHISEVGKILREANKNGIQFIDTAQSYKESEINIGKFINENLNFKLITKLDLDGIDISSIYFDEILELKLQKSLKNLNVNSLEAILIHDSDILKNKNSFRLIEWLRKIKSRKIVKKIGVSIYEKSDLFFSLNYFDIIQMPLSIYDQRLKENGTIEILKNNSIEIHLRSIFLQGLILQGYSKWPDFLNPHFIEHHKKISLIARENNLSLLELTICFLEKYIDAEIALMGITSEKELKEIIDASQKIKSRNSYDLDFRSFAWDDPLDIDPRKWIKK